MWVGVGKGGGSQVPVQHLRSNSIQGVLASLPIAVPYIARIFLFVPLEPPLRN